MHPIDLPDETLAGWKEQLDDYELIPFIPQLSAPVHRLTETEKQGDTLLRYSGKKVYLSNIYEFETADITTRIENNTLHIIDRSLNVVAQLSFVYEESDCFLKELYFSSVEEGEDYKHHTVAQRGKATVIVYPRTLYQHSAGYTESCLSAE